MSSANPLAALIADALGSESARPVFTFYDDRSGERVELSGLTALNWIAKIANLLADGLDCQPGDRIAVLLPLHWQSAVVLLGAWTAGLAVTPDPTDADVIFAAEPALPVALAAAPLQVVGLSLRALAGPLSDVPPGVLDFATEVLSFGDVTSPQPLAGPAYGALAAAQLVDAAEQAPGHRAGERLLTTLRYDVFDGIVHGLLAPLAAGGSIVLCRHPDPAALDRRTAVERVTATVGVDVTGLPRLF